MYNGLSPADKATYERALYGYMRSFGAKLIVRYANPSLVYTNTGNQILGENLTFESSAGGTGVFSLGSANIDTVTINCVYSGDDAATGISGAKENATLFELQCGYGFKQPNSSEDNIVYVPIGLYTLQSKSCVIGSNKYSLKLQSLMTKFDKSLPPVFDIANEMADEISTYNQPGCTPLIILLWCCKHVYKRKVSTEEWNIPMKLSSVMDPDTTEGMEYLASIPSMLTIAFNINQDTGYLTYRDIIKDVATVCGCFATMDREGNLALRPYTTAGDRYSLNVNSSEQGTFDIVTTYAEDVSQFRIDEIRCRTSVDDGSGGKIEVDFDYPITESDWLNNYDISGLKILSALDNTYYAQEISRGIWDAIHYEDEDEDTGTKTPHYAPIPFNVTTAAPDFRFDLGDWCHALSSFTDNQGNHLRCDAQLMSIKWTARGTCTYKSFNTPSVNDRNASKRQSEVDSIQSSSVVTPPVPPEPPVILLDDTAQWKFNDDEELIEEYEQTGTPGLTYHIGQIGQWSFSYTEE